MTQRPCFAMCLLVAIGLLAPRLVLVLMWLINSSFVLKPFSGTSVSNPLLPILGLLFLSTTTLGYCWATASFGGLSTFSGLLVVLIRMFIDFGLIGKSWCSSSLTIIPVENCVFTPTQHLLLIPLHPNEPASKAWAVSDLYRGRLSR